MRRSTLILAAALAAFGPAWVPGGMDMAHAQQNDKAARAEASRHFKLGVRLYAEGKYDEALSEFQRAYELSPHPSVLYNIAASHRELSHYGESIQFFEQFLAEAQGKVKPDLLARAKQELAEVRSRIGSVTLDVTPEGVMVSIDGREIAPEQLDKPVILGPGRHTVVLRAPSGKVETRQVALAAGDEITVQVDLSAPEPGTTTDAVPPVNGATGTTGSTGSTGSTAGSAGGIAIDAEPAPGTRGSMGLSVGGATSVLLFPEAGAFTVGAHLRTGPVVLGADVILVAWAVVPSVRLHLAGSDTLAVHATLAMPINLTNDGQKDVFVAGAAGLGLRYWFLGSIAVRAEALASLAGSGRGFTVPVSMAIELWR